MSSTYKAELVSIEGTDAVAFAHAQFSSDVANLADGRWQFSAWLDPQGRVRALFHLLRLDGQRLRLLLRGGDANELSSQLQRYVFRAKARIAPLPTASLGTGAPLPLHASDENGGALRLGCGTHSLEAGGTGDDAWRLAHVRAGWPWLPDGLPGGLLAASLGLDRLGATALNKGCYPGQEIVARLHYRGGNKRHLRQVRLSRPLPPGSPLHADGQAWVQLLDVVPVDSAAEALAVVHDDFAARLTAGSHASHGDQEVFVQGIECADRTLPA